MDEIPITCRYTTHNIRFTCIVNDSDDILAVGLEELRHLVFQSYISETPERTNQLSSIVEWFREKGLINDDQWDDMNSLKRAVVTDKHLKDNYPFESITITTNTCPGCINDSLNQRDHMECFHGCLHDTSFCEECG